MVGGVWVARGHTKAPAADAVVSPSAEGLVVVLGNEWASVSPAREASRVSDRHGKSRESAGLGYTEAGLARVIAGR